MCYGANSSKKTMESSSSKYKWINRLDRAFNLKHKIGCSMCDKTFANGKEYRKHWIKKHLKNNL
jgi:uncharacterized C2H2 Zn-finger protein